MLKRLKATIALTDEHATDSRPNDGHSVPPMLGKLPKNVIAVKTATYYAVRRALRVVTQLLKVPS